MSRSISTPKDKTISLLFLELTECHIGRGVKLLKIPEIYPNSCSTSIPALTSYTTTSWAHLSLTLGASLAQNPPLGVHPTSGHKVGREKKPVLLPPLSLPLLVLSFPHQAHLISPPQIPSNSSRSIPAC